MTVALDRFQMELIYKIRDEALALHAAASTPELGGWDARYTAEIAVRALTEANPCAVYGHDGIRAPSPWGDAPSRGLIDLRVPAVTLHICSRCGAMYHDPPPSKEDADGDV